jgi:hypothetical protein
MPQIKIRFAKSGATTIETTGFTGTACQGASEFVEKALGNSSNDEKTAEFYEESEAHAHLNVEDESE